MKTNGPTSVKNRKGKKYFSLQLKFLAGLAVLFLLFSSLAAGLIYRYQKNNIENEAFQQTELIMTAAGASRQYVQDVLRPKMFERFGEDVFMLEAMSSSYISRMIMENVRDRIPEFSYRRVSVNARNPEFEATEFERRIIDFFRDNPEEKNWQGIITEDGKQYYKRFQPVIFSSECSRCHGSPREAPTRILELYGDSRGFNSRLDDHLGVVSVGIPVDAGFDKIREVAFSIFSTLSLAMFLLFGMISFFFNRLIVQNIKGILSVFRETLQEEDTEHLVASLRYSDEIDELNEAAGTMAHHLKVSRQQIRDYTENLEMMVAQRTRELERSQQQLQQNINARNRELKTLITIAELITQSMDLAGILPKLLRQAQTVVPADGAGIYLLDEFRSRLVLHCSDHGDDLVPELPVDMDTLDSTIGEADSEGAVCDTAFGQLNFASSKDGLQGWVNLPICCRDRVLGVITFLGASGGVIDPDMKELLFSIGRQAGITIESLKNLNEITRGKELLQTVFDGIGDYVVLLDGRCRFLMVNRAFLRGFGVSGDQVVNRSATELGEILAHPFTACELFLDRRKKEAVTEYRQMPDGVIYEIHYYPNYNEDDGLQNMVCYAKNVTETRRIEQRMQQTEKLMALGQLAAGVAHELNNPLGVILCYAEILKEDLREQPGVLEDIGIIEKHAGNCQRIVAGLLNFSRKKEVRKERDAINPVVEEVVSMVQAKFRKENVALEVELGQDLPEIHMDRDLIRQVLVNILVNAVQAISETGRVKVSTVVNRERRQVRVIVEDNGTGIMESDIDRIFDPFFTTKEVGAGTGLGLSIAYGIVRDHGGEINVESEPGHGTCFTVALPIMMEQ